MIKCDTSYNFRRDYYLDSKLYNEDAVGPIPKEGGRLQFVTMTKPGLTIAYPLTVKTNKFEIVLKADTFDGENYPATKKLDWVRCDYDITTGTVLTTMHVNSDAILEDEGINSLKVVDKNDQVIVENEDTGCNSDCMDKGNTKVQVTYATTRSNFKTMVLHLHNYHDDDATIDYVTLNGQNLTNPNIRLEGKQHYALNVNAESLNLKETGIWTTVLNVGGKKYGFGGYLLKEEYPLEDWEKGDDLPWPNPDGSNDCNNNNYETLKNDLRLNTRFLHGNQCADDENKGLYEWGMKQLDSDFPFFFLPNEDTWLKDVDHMPDAKYAPVIAAAYLADEIDGHMINSWEAWSRVMMAEDNMRKKNGPFVPTYTGGHSNRLNGAFSGISDIQGMDFYVAGCAPHITSFDNTMRIQGAYDYLINTRNNMKPMPTWLYSQAFCMDCWEHYALNTGELLVQFGSVVAAGGKGIMLFQSDVKSKAKDSTAWDNGGKFLSSMYAIREILRISDVDGAKYDTDADHAIVSVLGGPETALVIFLNTNADSYNDVTCYAGIGRHWNFHSEKINKTKIYLPQNLKDLASRENKSPSEYFEIVEVHNGSLKTDFDDADGDVSDESFTLKNVELGSSASVVRMFMLHPKQ